MANEYRHFEHLDPTASHPSPLLFEKGRTVCFGFILVGAVLGGLAWMMDAHHFYHSYLASWSFVWTTMVGVLFFVMLHHVVDAGWSTVIRRPAEQMLAAMPVVMALLIPVLIGYFTGHLHHWVSADIHQDHLLEKKQWWLNLPFLAVRMGIYVLVFIALAHVMRRNSLRQDQDGSGRWTLSSRRWSAGGLILYALAVTACSFDLLMALDHHWFSTVFGVYVWAGGVVSALCVLALVAMKLERGPLHEYLSSDTIHDLGKLIFAFSVFWAYIAFSQYFLIWYGNIPEETVWFLRRWAGLTQTQDGWWWIPSVLLVVGRFVLPFFVLMSAHAKRNRKVLGVMCWVLLASHWLDQYWIVQPEISKFAPPLRWIWVDIAAVMLIGGLAGLIFVAALRKAALFPTMDPRLVEALSAEHVEEIEQADVE